MPIDFSKINLSVLPKGGNVVKSPSRTKAPLGGRIDYGAIKLSNIYAHAKAAPKPAQKIPVSAVSSTPFIGRPLVTPVEQQRMKAAAPKPTSSLSLWLNGKTVEQRALEGKQMASAFAGKSFFDGFKEVVDSYNNATAKGFMGSAAPAAGGITGNRWVDLGASLATMGAVIQTGVQVVGGLVSAINFTRAMNSKWNWPTVEGSGRDVGAVSNGLAVRVAQANPNMDKGTASSIASLVARTGGNAARLNALVSNASTLSRSLDKISLAAQNPLTAFKTISSEVQFIAKTGIFQAIPMPAGLVHSTAPAIPMGGKTQPALAASTPTPAQEVAPQETTNLITKPWPKAPAAVARPVQAPAVKSYADIMAKEEAMGARLNTAPRVVDKTIPAIDVKKANLVDVTAKVDLKSVQVKFPTATNVFVDTKRGTVLFTNGMTPLEAIGVDKPQLKTWYGIDGAKLLGEATQPAPVVAQVAPTLSKMETPAANIEGLDYPESVDIAARKVADAAQLKSPAYIRNKKITDDLAKRGIMRGSSLTDNPDLKEATRVWSNAYDVEVRRLTSTPDLSTTPQKGTATTISNQKTGISTSTPVSPRVGTQTGAEGVKWGKWKKVGNTEYRLVNGLTQVRQWGKSSFQSPTFGKLLQFKGDPHSYFLMRDNAVPASKGFPAVPASYRIIEARSGNSLVLSQPTVDGVVSAARESLDKYNDTDARISELVGIHGGEANPVPTSVGTPASVPTAPISSTSAPAASPSIGNATPAHGLIDYSQIELNGTTSQTSPKVLASVGNAGKGSRVEAKGFNNYVQNTPGTTNTSLSPFAKFKAIRDGYIRFIANEYNWFFKSPLGGEWMTIAVAADDIMLEEYKNPFYINEAGEQVFVEGEFGPKILSRCLKASDVINKRYLQGANGVDLVAPDGKKIKNPNYGKPDFGVFLQNLQRAGIPIEATKELGADKTNLAQQHIADAWISLKNFQKNLPQLFAKYMAQAQEIGDANARLLPEFYKGIISPETYANDKANPHYYVSLSAGKTDIFDRSSVAPLERAHGLTNLDEVVPPLEGLMDAYVAAIRAQGINRAKIKTVEWNKSSEVATTVLSDSIVHLWKDGVDRAFEVHDKDAGASIRNLTRSKWEVPSLVKMIFTLPTTLMRLAATGANIAFGAFNPVRDIIQAAGLVPFTPTGLVKGTVKAFKSPGLSQWSKDYRDPTRPTGTKVTEAVKKIVEFVSIPSNVGESLGRSGISESIKDLGGTYLDQFYGYHAGTGFFALHGTFFNDFISGLVPFTRATIAVVRAFYRNSFYGLPIGDKGGKFSWKQGTEKILGKNFLATIIFTLIEIAAIKAAGKEKEYKLLRDRASNFYLYQPSGNWVRLSVPILSAPIKAIVESLYGFESDPIDVAEQTLNVIPGLGALMLPPVLTTYLQYKFNINFFTGSPINTKYDTPAKNPLEAAIMKLGYTEEQADMALRSFFADIPSQVQYVFEMVTQGTSTQAFPLTKRFIVKDPTTSSNAAVDDFYALVDAVKASKNPALEHYVNGKASDIGKLIKNAKLYPAEAKLYMTTATDNIIATFATIAENPDVYGIKKFGPFSWRPSGNYEELAP